MYTTKTPDISLKFYRGANGVIIGVDGTCLQGVRTGVGWYLTHLLEAMSHVLEEDKVYVWMNNPTAQERARVSENRFIVVNATHYPMAALKLTWNTLGTPAMDSLIGRPADVYFYPNYLPLPQKQGKKVLFVHDLTFLTNPDLASQESIKTLGTQLEKQEEKADLILTCSEYNRQEMIKHFRHLSETKIRMIPHGLGEPFRKPAAPDRVKAVREKHRLSKPYFLFVGDLEPRKNLLRLVHAFLLFKQKSQAPHELILAGPKGWIGEEFMQFILSPQLADKVRWLDYVQDEDMPGLYTGAEAFVFASLKEGFGMPLLEAMGCGVPVLCSNSAAIPEVVGDAAWMMDPSNVNDWSLAMHRIVTEPQFGQLLRDKGKTRVSLFQIENTAKQTLAALKMAVQSHG
jgi:glycosyltransferase involved in cell wall biosynthesis